MNNHHIRNIIFDLGGVILDIDPQKTIDEFEKLGWSVSDQQNGQALGTMLFFELETGNDSPETFRDKIRKVIGTSVSDQIIDEAWSAMIVHIPAERIRYLERLKEHYRIYLLSNTNEIHRIKFHKMFEENFGYTFNRLFERNFYSHEMGLRKPNPAIFEKALKETGLNPQETLFVDDLAENVAAAEAVGINGLHITAGTLLEALPTYLKENH